MGFLLYQYSRCNNQHQSELILIATLPEFLRQGVASFLLKIVETGEFISNFTQQPVKNEAKYFFSHEVFLDVAQDNEKALQFYRKNGYQPYGKRKDYYPRKIGKIDAILMKKCFI